MITTSKSQQNDADFIMHTVDKLSISFVSMYKFIYKVVRWKFDEAKK